MACTETNYKDVVVRANPSSFVIYPLENSTDYTWNLKNKFGQNYMGDGTSDSQGRLTIPVTLPLRPDFFHPFSGDWVLTMYRGSTSIIFCGLYTNITLHFESIITDDTDAVIDLDCSPGLSPSGPVSWNDLQDKPFTSTEITQLKQLLSINNDDPQLP